MPVKTKLLTAACALTFAFYASAASAAPTVINNQGSGKLPSYTTAQIFETFDNGFNPATDPSRSGSLNTGGVFEEYLLGQASLVSGQLNFDDAASSKVLDLANRDIFYIAFQNPQQFFSTEYASVGGPAFVDFQLHTDDGVSDVYENLWGSGRLSLDVGGASGLTEVQIRLQSGTIDLDNIAAAAPEPATWASMILGLGAIGFIIRRQRKTRTTFKFA